MGSGPCSLRHTHHVAWHPGASIVRFGRQKGACQVHGFAVLVMRCWGGGGGRDDIANVSCRCWQANALCVGWVYAPLSVGVVKDGCIGVCSVLDCCPQLLMGFVCYIVSVRTVWEQWFAAVRTFGSRSSPCALVAPLVTSLPSTQSGEATTCPFMATKLAVLAPKNVTSATCLSHHHRQQR